MLDRTICPVPTDAQIERIHHAFPGIAEYDRMVADGSLHLPLPDGGWISDNVRLHVHYPALESE